MSPRAALIVVLVAVAFALASSSSPTSPRWYHTLYARLPSNVQDGIAFVTEALSNQPYVPTAADIQYIRDVYSSDGRAKTVHDRIPRFGYSNDLVGVVVQVKQSSVGFDGEVKSYGIGLAILFGIGLIIAFITLLAGIIYAICKCCKCCCCRGDQIPLFKERKVCPMVTLLIACLTASAFGVLGIVYNEKLHSDIGGSNDGIVGTAINTLGKSSTFLTNISVPIRDVQTALPAVVNNIQAIISNTDTIVRYGLSNLTSMMLLEANYIGNPPVNFTISNSTYRCDYCVDAYTQVNDAVNTINSNAQSTIISMLDLIKSAQTDVTGKQTEISNRLNDVFNNIADVQQQLLDKKYQAQYQTRDVSSRDNQRRIGTLVLLLLPASALILGVVGLIVRKALPFQILYWFSFVMVFFTALVFAITLPLSAMMGDSCVFMDTIDPDITQYGLVTNDSARIAVSCLTNAWVLGPNVLNLSNELNFTNSLKFPPEVYTPAAQYLNFTELDRFALQVINLDTRTFGYDPAVTDGLLADMKRLTGQTWSRQNVTSSSPDVNNYPTMSSQNKTILGQERDAVVTYVQVETTLNSFLAQLRQNVSNITTYANNMKTALTNAQSQIINLQGLLAPILDPANRLLDMAYCGFLGDSYRDLKQLYCNNLMAEVSYLCLAVFIITLMGIFMIIFGAHMANLEGENADAKKYDEDNPAADGDLPMKPMDGSQPQVLPMGAGQPQPYAGPYGAQSMPIQPYQTSQGLGFKSFLTDGFGSPSAPASAPPAAYGGDAAPPPYQPSSPQPLLPQNRSARVEITDMSPAAPSSRVSAASANLSPALAPANESTGEGEATN